MVPTKPYSALLQLHLFNFDQLYNFTNNLLTVAKADCIPGTCTTSSATGLVQPVQQCTATCQSSGVVYAGLVASHRTPMTPLQVLYAGAARAPYSHTLFQTHQMQQIAFKHTAGVPQLWVCKPTVKRSTQALL